MKKLSLTAALVAVALIWLGLAFWPRAVSAQIPDKFTNLKALPQDIGRKDLVNFMKNITFALDTRCWFCHEGEGDDLSTYNFASDKKHEKMIARSHIQMTREVNEKYFKDSEEKAEVTCYTCHKGEKEPPPK
ncbi:MAG: c-type cytochrome [Acidobacteriota bacterium]